MRIPDTVAHHLHAKAVPFELLHHTPTSTSLGTAQAAHVPGHKVAKAIVLEDGSDYCLAVLPATHHIDLDSLSALLNRPVRMVAEADLPMIFRDCKPGAVPPLGEAYGVSTVVESDLAKEDDFYLEGGDHEHLLHVDRDGFTRLLGESKTGHFSHSINS